MYLDNITDYKEARNVYFKLAKELHPDHGGSDEKMKILNLEWEALITSNRNMQGSKVWDNPLKSVIDLAVSLGLTAELCGVWVWVSGDTKPHKKALKQAKMRWHPKKAMWYFREGKYYHKNKNPQSMGNIRFKYGSRVYQPASIEE